MTIKKFLVVTALVATVVGPLLSLTNTLGVKRIDSPEHLRYWIGWWLVAYAAVVMITMLALDVLGSLRRWMNKNNPPSAH